MDVRITIETTFDNGEKRTHQLDGISRPYRVTCPDGIGLRLEDGKRIVEQIQRVVLYDQVDEIIRESRVCPTCGSVRAIHDYRTRVLDTLFGRVRVKAARLRRCSCDARSAAMPGGPISPLAYFFPDRASPELQRLHAELGSRHSFREAARLMKSFLPCHPPHHTTVRNRLGRVATGLEKSRRASGDPVEAPPKGGLTVFLDGAHIRCRPVYQQRHLDLVFGRIESRNMCRRFGLVANATASPGSRMREELSDFGWKPGRLLTVISDGELALPNLIRNAMDGDGQVKHILDWWHISMRIRHVEALLSRELAEFSNWHGDFCSSDIRGGFPRLESLEPMVTDGESGAAAGWDRETIAGCGLHGDETLQSTGRSEALHHPLSFSKW